MPVDLNDDDIKTFVIAKLAEAEDSGDENALAHWQDTLSTLQEDIDAIEDEPAPRVPCRTCNGGPLLNLPTGIKCAGCGVGLSKTGAPLASDDIVIDGIAYYPIDEDNESRTYGRSIDMSGELM